MENLSKNIAKKISLELNLDNDKRDIIAYGTIGLIQTLISLILVVIVGAIFGVALEAFIVALFSSALRKCSGGIHASTAEICTTISIFICVGFALGMKYIETTFGNLNFIILVGCILFLWSYYIIYKYAPVDSPNKPIKTLAKKQRMRRGSILTLTIYLVLVLVNILLYIIFKKNFILVYILCIYAGFAWQCFTLTKIGHIVGNSMDSLLKNLINVIKGGLTHEKS